MTDSIRVLVVDDEKGVRFFLEETLRRQGYEVVPAASGEEALQLLRDTFFDVILLDLKLGGRADGLRVLEAVRWRWPESVVIILTAHGSLESAVSAIREGVDGYLLKPVDPAEVRSAVQEALDRREMLLRAAQNQRRGQVLSVGPFYLDLDKHVAQMNDVRLDLTPQEWALLVYLIRNRHRVVDPVELVRAVHGYEPEDLYEARQIIKWYIHRLRQKVEPDPSKPRYILNVRGVGYTWGE